MAKLNYAKPTKTSASGSVGTGGGCGCGLGLLICLGISALGTWMGFNMDAPWLSTVAVIFVTLFSIGCMILGYLSWRSERLEEQDGTT